jgi:hypothetical protein
MAIQVRVFSTHQVSDPMRLGTEKIFYSRVALVPDPNRNGYEAVIFFTHGNPTVTRYFTTAMILDCEQVKICSFYDINYDLL